METDYRKICDVLRTLGTAFQDKAIGQELGNQAKKRDAEHELSEMLSAVKGLSLHLHLTFNWVYLMPNDVTHTFTTHGKIGWGMETQYCAILDVSIVLDQSGMQSEWHVRRGDVHIHMNEMENDDEVSGDEVASGDGGEVTGPTTDTHERDHLVSYEDTASFLKSLGIEPRDKK